jgi:hypothetical protein
MLGESLRARGLQVDLVVVGGSALLLRDITTRPTRDFDVMAIVEAGGYKKAEPIPSDLQEAVRDVGQTLDIGPDWLNGKAGGLLDFELPEGFQSRTEERRFGTLTVHIAGRADLIVLKLDAAVSEGVRSRHFSDLQALEPTDEDLLAAGRWLTTAVDSSAGFRAEMIQALRALGVTGAEQRL